MGRNFTIHLSTGLRQAARVKTRSSGLRDPSIATTQTGEISNSILPVKKRECKMSGLQRVNERYVIRESSEIFVSTNYRSIVLDRDRNNANIHYDVTRQSHLGQDL